MIPLLLSKMMKRQRNEMSWWLTSWWWRRKFEWEWLGWRSLTNYHRILSATNPSYISVFIARLLVATLHVGMTRFQDDGYTQLAQLQWDYLRWVKYHSLTSSYSCVWMMSACNISLHPGSTENVPHCAIWHLRGSLDENASLLCCLALSGWFDCICVL